jgi:hypothetical protein
MVVRAVPSQGGTGRGVHKARLNRALLADLLSIPTGDRYPPLDLTPKKRKEKSLRAQLAQVEGWRPVNRS